MKKRIALTFLGLLIIIFGLGGIKALQIMKMVEAGENFVMPPETITTATATNESWRRGISSVGSVESVQGVIVTAEYTGKIVRIGFEPGDTVSKGTVLVQQDISIEQAQLRSAESSAKLAKINLDRMTKLQERTVVSQSELDQAVATYDESSARVDELKAIIRKKTVRAPFSGRLGLREVNLGEVINEGQPIVNLQSMDPVYVNFSLPQQELQRVAIGYDVEITTDAFPGRIMTGKITAIDSQIDSATRSVRIQATLPNSDEALRSGMFVKVTTILPGENQVVAVPITAVLNAPFGDQVFIVEDAAEGEGQALRAQFVRLGEKRGDFVSVLSGLQAGEVVASTGVFKLRNGQAVVVKNEFAPEFETEPTPENQ